MGETKVDETKLRDKGLNGAAREASAPNTDTKLRLDDEEDTLYEDALDLEDDSSPLTGINGRDDSIKPI
jgi:hypothetical protein